MPGTMSGTMKDSETPRKESSTESEMSGQSQEQSSPKTTGPTSPPAPAAAPDPFVFSEPDELLAKPLPPLSELQKIFGVDSDEEVPGTHRRDSKKSDPASKGKADHKKKDFGLRKKSSAKKRHAEHKLKEKERAKKTEESKMKTGSEDAEKKKMEDTKKKDKEALLMIYNEIMGQKDDAQKKEFPLRTQEFKKKKIETAKDPDPEERGDVAVDMFEDKGDNPTTSGDDKKDPEPLKPQMEEGKDLPDISPIEEAALDVNVPETSEAAAE